MTNTEILSKELRNELVINLNRPTNKLDEEYNKVYEETHIELVKIELDKLNSSTNIGMFIHSKIKSLPTIINSLMLERTSCDVNSKKAELNAKIDVLNVLNTKYIAESSKLAI